MNKLIRPILLGCTIYVVLAAVIAAPSWWRYLSPRVYKTASSPDGSWSVTVLRQRKYANPLREGIDVSIVLTDATGKTLLRKTIDTRDLWHDVDVGYRDVICRNDEVLLGPQYWDGTQLTYFKMNKRDFE